MERKELLNSKEYAVSQIQLTLLNALGEYKIKHGLNDTQLAHELNVSKGYISQLLNVTFDHKISKVVEISKSCNKMPLLFLVDIDEFIINDEKGKFYELVPMFKPSAITYTRESENKVAVSNSPYSQVKFNIQDVGS